MGVVVVRTWTYMGRPMKECRKRQWQEGQRGQLQRPSWYQWAEAVGDPVLSQDSLQGFSAARVGPL